MALKQAEFVISRSCFGAIFDISGISMQNQRDAVAAKSANRPGADFAGAGEKGEIGTRLAAAVKLAGGNSVVATKSGIALRTLARLLAGQEPKVEHLVRLTEACGVSLDWLATGRLPVHPVDRLADLVVPTLHEGVLLKVIEAVEAVPESRVLTPHKKAQVIGALYSMWAEGEIPSAEKGLDTAARLVALAS